MKKAIEDRLPIRTMKNKWGGQLFYFSHFDPNSGTTVRGTAPIPEFKGISYQEERELKEKWNKKYSWHRDKPFSPSPEVIDIKITDFCDFGCAYCAVPGTMISTPGGLLPIEEILVGQKVVSSDEDGSLRIDEVSQVFEREYEGDIIVIEMEDRTVLELTPNHEVYVS